MQPLSSSLTPLQQSLVVLTAVRNSVERAVLVFYNVEGSNLSDRPDRWSDVNLRFSLQKHLQILLSSFLEEWGRFSSLAKDNHHVRGTLRQVKPAIDRFRGWKALPSVRSKLLAHPFRDERGSIVFAWDVFRESDAPSTFPETLLLGFCVLMAVDGVKERHAQHLADAESQLLQRERSVPQKGISTTDELEAELARIQADLQAGRGH